MAYEHFQLQMKYNFRLSSYLDSVRQHRVYHGTVDVDDIPPNATIHDRFDVAILRGPCTVCHLSFPIHAVVLCVTDRTNVCVKNRSKKKLIGKINHNRNQLMKWYKLFYIIEKMLEMTLNQGEKWLWGKKKKFVFKTSLDFASNFISNKCKNCKQNKILMISRSVKLRVNLLR